MIVVSIFWRWHQVATNMMKANLCPSGTMRLWWTTPITVMWNPFNSTYVLRMIECITGAAKWPDASSLLKHHLIIHKGALSPKNSEAGPIIRVYAGLIRHRCELRKRSSIDGGLSSFETWSRLVTTSWAHSLPTKVPYQEDMPLAIGHISEDMLLAIEQCTNSTNETIITNSPTYAEACGATCGIWLRKKVMKI